MQIAVELVSVRGGGSRLEGEVIRARISTADLTATAPGIASYDMALCVSHSYNIAKVAETHAPYPRSTFIHDILNFVYSRAHTFFCMPPICGGAR